MRKLLFAWIGRTDLKSAVSKGNDGLGPIANALDVRTFDQACFLNNYPPEEVTAYTDWLKFRTSVPITIHNVTLTSPTNFGEIYEAAVACVDQSITKFGSDLELTFHLSPGTPAMAAVWILLAKTRYQAELLESSVEQGVKTANVPFDISADYIPSLLQKSDDRLQRLSAGLPPEAPEFDQIIHRSLPMQHVVAMARRISIRSVPVLIEGESGTGKELLARAIHGASPRGAKPFVAVNCGAIPSELVESEFFGHKKGSFTGAVEDRKGYFEAANGGTLFLDEIGELPLKAQVKILRALQEKEVSRVGETSPIPVDVRIIAATNRNLLKEVAEHRFRVDLYYRLAVAVLQLPPLRKRDGDVSLLIDHFLEQINTESKNEPGYVHKNISANARNIMLTHTWPGNARELFNVIYRAAIWSSEKNITDQDLREIIQPLQVSPPETTSPLTLGEGVNLPELLANFIRLHLKKALEITGGNKTKAAKLLGLPNYQTFSNWCEKYGVEI
ncbi:sigma-54 interaction domain-containing protein [Geomonas azotofigens]|uniref:sigma-54 interaction domain-containing protein n=1 Tax=Geomonas azotofigens TaxID=2843196 RepID=UPI001C105C79|nr:sigma-54 dependent transcriptional regulator [Geomonas azotofigens]MBU5614468.1 sigma-54 dependent transcriptional regulator [Geomonas azotofigens]